MSEFMRIRKVWLPTGGLFFKSLTNWRLASVPILLFALFMMPLELHGEENVFSGVDTTKRVEAKELFRICADRGGLQGRYQERLSVDGYYLPRTSPMFGIDQIVNILVRERYQFFEMDTAWVKRHGGWSPFSRRLIGGKGKYIRFYITKAGDENCTAYRDYVQFQGNKTKTFLRANGLYPESCMAAVKTDTLKSTYGIIVTLEQDREKKEIEWEYDAIRNLSTGDIYASYQSFTHCWQGRKKNGSCRGGSGKRYRCPDDLGKRLDICKKSGAIYYCIFKSTPNPHLKKRLTLIDINEPIPVPIHYVTPELLETVTDKTKIKELKGDEYFDLYRPFDREGRVWFEKKRAHWVEGDEKHSTQYLQLAILNDTERKLLQVDIHLGKKGMQLHPKVEGKVSVFDNFGNLRAIPGDAIYFILTPSVNSKNNNKFFIMRYSWQGKLLRITAGDMPFPIIKKNEYQRRYAHLQVLEDEYRFSVLDDCYQCGYKPLKPRKEFKFRVPFK